MLLNQAMLTKFFSNSSTTAYSSMPRVATHGKTRRLPSDFRFYFYLFLCCFSTDYFVSKNSLLFFYSLRKIERKARQKEVKEADGKTRKQSKSVTATTATKPLQRHAHLTLYPRIVQKRGNLSGDPTFLGIIFFAGP